MLTLRVMGREFMGSVNIEGDGKGVNGSVNTESDGKGVNGKC